MRKGLALIIIGHINFIFGAIVHGSILRHISKPSQQISTEYTVTNIISVTSGLLVSQWFSFCVLKSTWHFKWACCEPSDIKPPGVSAFIKTFYFKVFITQSYLQSLLYQQFCLFDAWEHQKLTRVIYFYFFFNFTSVIVLSMFLSNQDWTCWLQESRFFKTATCPFGADLITITVMYHINLLGIRRY